MFKARLELNHSQLDLGAEILGVFVSFLPERRDASDVFEELAQHPGAEVREAVASKKPLTDETVRLLAQDKSQAVLIALINNDAANQQIPASRVDEFIATDDSAMLRTIFQNIQNMTQLDTARIVNSLANHKDASLRREVARSSDTGIELLHHLARDEDPDVRDAALKTIQGNCGPDNDFE